eukprot:TRINITY_DN4590_c3_g1_i1.p1 TRINITY_DN4590_c3_g1~~TRINITY_DN4590_c3_g1_i1.p1  ORF type:complete len:127 (-),score=41.46 TRINITY_DN4590_c3_g1_i1:247-627(-)
MEEDKENDIEKDEGQQRSKRVKREGKEKKIRSTYPKNRKSVMRRKPLPSHLFALDGLSDAMENFIAGRTSFSYFEDVSQDPFHDDYKEHDGREPLLPLPILGMENLFSQAKTDLGLGEDLLEQLFS